MRKLYLLCFAFLCYFAGHSQAVNTYLFTTGNTTFTPITGTSDPLANDDDANGATAIPIGFSFVFGGVTYTTVTANSNGYLTFNATPSTNATDQRGNSFTATAAGIKPMVAPLWDDLDGRVATPASAASYTTTGAVGSRVFTYQWLNWSMFSATGNPPGFSFQAKLYEGTNVIEFIYRQDVASASGVTSATVGIAGSPTDYLSLQNLSINPTVSSTTSNNALTGKPATGQIYRFTPASPCPATVVAGTITGSNVACNGKPAVISVNGQTVATGTTYQWKSSTTSGGPYTNITGATGTSISIPSVTATTYYVVTTTCGTGTATTAEFAVSQAPTPAISVTPATSAICSGGNVALTATGGSTYVWSPSAGLSSTTGATVTASPTATTVYSVSATAANGCIGTASASVTVGQPLTAAVSAANTFVCNNGSTQLTATAGTSYTAIPVAYAPVATPGTGVTTLVNNNGTATPALTAGSLDDGTWNITLPFPFVLYGTSYTAASINTNGYVEMGSVNTTGGYGVSIPNTATPNATIHGFTMDLNLGTSGTVNYFTTGTAPNRRFVINYINVPFWSGGGTLTAQIVLNETSNAVDVYLTDVTNTATTKTQGIENAAGTAATVIGGRNGTTTWTGFPDGFRFQINPVNTTWVADPTLSSTTGSPVTATGITGTKTYTANITDPVTGCVGTGTVTVTAGAPLVVTASGPAGTICGGTPSRIRATVTGGGQPYTYSWSNGTSVVATTDTTTVTPPATTTYTVTVTDACGATGTATVTLNISNPQITGTTPVTRCGPGTATVSATATAGSTIRWYSAATGGTAIASGSSYTNPALTGTTTYYASAEVGGAPIGLGATTITTSSANPYYGGWGGRKAQYLILASELTALGYTAGNFNSLTFYVVAPSTRAYNDFSISMGSTALTALTTTFVTGLTTVYSAPSVTTVAGPNAYQFTTPFAWNGTSNVVVNICWNNGDAGNANGTSSVTADAPGFTCTNYDNQDNSTIALVCGSTTADATLTTRPRMLFNSYCTSSPRTAVVATVTAPPAFTVSTNTSVCNNAIKQLSVTSPAANYSSYTWTPAAGLFTDPAATVPYVAGASATTVYLKTTTPGLATYYINALNTTSTCTALDSIKVNVLPASAVINATPASICVSGTAALSIVPQSNYILGTIQWFSSTNGTSYTVITGPTGVNYVTPTLTSNMFYRADIKDAAGTVCLQPTVSVPVVNPTITSTTPNANCGTGTVNLTAAASAGSTIRWYTAATGGQVVGTGTSFTTPTLTQTTTYYAAAEVGTGPIGAGANTSTSYESPYYHLYGGKKSQYLILASELTAAGYTAGNMNSLSFFVVAGGATYNSFSISMGATTNTNMTGGLVSGLTTVYTAPSVTTTVGANTYGFLAPFNWNGTSNVVVEVCWSNNNGGGTSSTVKTDNTSFVSHSYFRADNQTPAVLCAATTQTGTQSIRPQMQFGSYCAGNRVAVVATISPNTAITAQPTALSICSGATINLSVTAVGANLTYQWRKDGVNIAGATSSTYSFPSASPAQNGVYTVVITGLCGNVTSNGVTVTVAPANSWVGTTNSDWNNATNWCGGVPTQNTDVIIPAGTPFQPTLSSSGDARNITVNSGATLTVTANGLLGVYGNFTNSGTFAASTGAVVFKGAANQSVGAMTAGTVIMNGAGGITLAGNMTAITTLTLVNGNITLGTFNLTLANTANGSLASHVITNGTGSVISNNINATPVVVPVAPTATSYNPVTIANGQGRNYTVRVATGINPAITNSNRAINRTWTVTSSSAVSSNVSLTFRYDDADGNSGVTPGDAMELGIHNGTQWNLATPPGGITPVTVGGTSRQVTVQTNTFGPMVLSNGGGFTYPTAVSGLDPDIASAKLMPNVVSNQTILRVVTRRTMDVNWVITDATGKVVMTFNRKMAAGTTDIQLTLGQLASGAYHLTGFTDKGKVPYLRLVRL